VLAAAKKVIGYVQDRMQWISASTWKVIDERKQLKQEKLNQQLTDEQRDSLAEQYKVKDKEVKRRCARVKQAWYDLKASEDEEAAQRSDQKTVYRIVKDLRGKKVQSQQVKLKDGRFAGPTKNN